MSESRTALLSLVRIRLRKLGYSEADIEDICSYFSDRPVQELKKYVLQLASRR